MYLTRACLSNPRALFVGAILLFIFGTISLSRLPIQLTPELEEPEITITTVWRSASPNEIETEIIEPQEDVLRGLPGLTEIRAKAFESRGEINLTFAVDIDMRRALIEVMNRLNQVSNYPRDAEEPSISTVGEDARAIAWFIIKTKDDNQKSIESYKDFVEEVVQSKFERVPGVARSEIFGGMGKELRITYDPYKIAHLGIEINKIINLASTSKDVSGGFADVGKRKYSVRFAGKYDAEELGQMILMWRNDRPIYLRDVATIEEKLIDKDSFVLTKGSLSIAINAKRESGVNVLDVMTGLKSVVDELNSGPLERAGLNIEQVYDETLYIERSIRMLRNNLGLGISLSIVILFLFTAKFPATLIELISSSFEKALFIPIEEPKLAGFTKHG